MAEEKKDDERVTFTIGKRNKLLNDINKQLGGLELETVYEFNDHKYRLKSLTNDEEIWSDTYANLGSEISAFTSLRSPRLAAAISHIDDIPVDDLFEFPDEMSEAEKKVHTGSKYNKRYWIMSQMLLFLGDKPSNFINEMWKHYSENVMQKREEVLDNLKKSSAGTPDGELKVTSSQEKAS